MNVDRKAGSFEPNVANIFSDGYPDCGNGTTPPVKNKSSTCNAHSMASSYRQPQWLFTMPLAWSSEAQEPMCGTALQSKPSSKMHRCTTRNTRRLMVAPHHEEALWAGKTYPSIDELLGSQGHCGDLHLVSSVDSMPQTLFNTSNLNMFSDTQTNLSLFPSTECRVQSLDGLMKQESPPLDMKNASNAPKRPAGDDRAPQKKNRPTRTLEKRGEAEGNCGWDEGSNDVNRCVESFVCPFYRRHPERYFDCISLKMPRISDVKQHLKRRHMANYFCPRCFKGFSALKPFQEHVLQQDCSMNLSENNDGVSPTTQDALRVRFERGLSPKGQWYKMWKILFGDIDGDKKPYHEGVFKEITGIIRGIWTEEGQLIISNVQKTRDIQDIPKDCADELRPAVLELLARVETRFEEKALEGNSKKRSNNVESTLDKPAVDTIGPTQVPSPGIQTNIAPHDTTLSSFDLGLECTSSGSVGSVKKMCGLSMPSGSQNQQTETRYPDFTARELLFSSDEDDCLHIEPHNDLFSEPFEPAYLESVEDSTNVVDLTQDYEVLGMED